MMLLNTKCRAGWKVYYAKALLVVDCGAHGLMVKVLKMKQELFSRTLTTSQRVKKCSHLHLYINSTLDLVVFSTAKLYMSEPKNVSVYGFYYLQNR